MKYKILKLVTCRNCNIVFENKDDHKYYTYCPKCGKVKDTHDRQESRRTLVEFRKSMGLCVYCGKIRPQNNKSRCKDCINLSTSHKRSSREKKIAEGLCSRCGKEPLIKDRSANRLIIGMDCQKMLNRSRARSYHRLKANHKCVSCYRRDAAEGLTNCDHCRNEKNYASSVRHWIWRFSVIFALGGKCKGCGNSELDILHIHHRELYRHGHTNDQHRLSWMKITEQLRRNEHISKKFWSDVKNGKLFILCPNCNWRDAINQMGSIKAREEALSRVKLEGLALNLNNEKYLST
jgi:hypothetical protein